MSNKMRIALVNKAYDALEFLDEIDRTKYRAHCFGLALAGERAHKRAMGAMACPLTVAARCHVVVWIARYAISAERSPSIGDILHLRDDCIYAAALAAVYRESILHAFTAANLDRNQIAGIDYVKLVNGAP